VQDQWHPWQEVNHGTRLFSSKNGDSRALSDYPAASGRRARSGRTSRQSTPSNSAANCALDMRITPSRTCGQTNHFNWRKKYAGLLPKEMKWLDQLDDENSRLKKIVADLTLDREMLQDVIRRKI
jgi:hypothetical protein